ncbi:MAG: hypothetical protein ACXWQE_13920 [Bdellovibrionales bacterium]
MRFYFFYGCALLISMYLLGSTVLFPWAVLLDDEYGSGNGSYYRGSGSYHK